ncbi:hypothetical protein Bhyg_14302, partial [Pseudolycoriella hygida]
LAVVMSLPLEDLPAGRSVFCSYNFETNFYYPYYDNAAGIVPIPFTWIDEPGANAGTKHRISLPPAYRQFSDDNQGKQIQGAKVETKVGEQNKSKTRKTNKHKTKPSMKNDGKTNTRKVRTLLQNYLMSRRRFYKLMESQMDRSGIQGSDCMLMAICQTSEAAFGLNNGVIGSVIDVLFL